MSQDLRSDEKRYVTEKFLKAPGFIDAGRNPEIMRRAVPVSKPFHDPEWNEGS